MATDDINAQERLEAVHSIIISCEAAATEIENQFAQFDTTLAEAETRSTELIAELDESSADIVSHSEEFQTELTQNVGNIVERVGGFVSSMEGVLEVVESNSGELFNNLNDMDGAHDEIQTQIEENATHIKEIFDTLSNSWTEVAEKITSIQEQQHNEIDTNIRELSETQANEQEEDQSTTTEKLTEEYTEVIINNAQEHMDEVASDLKENFIPEVESLTEKNKEMQEQGGTDFSDMRTDTLDKMFGGAKNLYEAVDGVMDTMKGTVKVTSDVADVTVDAMDQTNIGLNQLNEAIENLLTLLGGLSLD